MLLMLHNSEAEHPSGHHYRSRHCQVGISGAHKTSAGNVLIPPSAEAPLCPGVLPEAVAMPGWYRGLCHVASLVAPTKALGHTVRLMPPAYVKPYVKRQKNDAADAEAICEAVTRATMRFVETKTPDHQSCLMLHRTRQLFIRQQTSVINAIRAHLAEFGIVAPSRTQGCRTTACVAADASDQRVPEVARACLAALGVQLRRLKAQILEFDRMIIAWHRSNESSRRLDAIPGIGPALATALVASVADPKAFRSGRNFSAWIGLVPKQHSSGGKDKLGSIQQARRSLSAQPVHRRRTRCDPLCQAPWLPASTLAYGIAGTAADQGRRHRACQQDRQNGLGHDGQGLSVVRVFGTASGII